MSDSAPPPRTHPRGVECLACNTWFATFEDAVEHLSTVCPKNPQLHPQQPAPQQQQQQEQHVQQQDTASWTGNTNDGDVLEISEEDMQAIKNFFARQEHVALLNSILNSI
ncbi:hypothetical protein GQ54DRAFT_299322 [Martensiomyces pterosporus]|nr:hypothetical protein GQ54DRAFT_299322 [Martensiomyces pterosporus]